MNPQKIRTFLWYDTQAEEAAAFYCSLFPDSRILSVTRYPEGTPGTPGTVMTVEFQLAGTRFVALNGGPHFPLTEAVSLTVDCESQVEINFLWDQLATGGVESRCGWLKDRYGLSWQIVPSILPQLLSSPEADRAGRAMRAVMTMGRLDLAAIQAAAYGE